MSGSITFFPVGNGDMTLIKLPGEGSYTILSDCYLLDETTDTCFVTVDDLYDELPEDEQGRPYVDAFVLTHPDKDHCLGAEKYLHLSAPEEYEDDPGDGERKKVFIREMWSSPLIYRRASKKFTLGADAKAINKEAKRRVEAYRSSDAGSSSDMEVGERILILGDDYKADDGADRLEGLEGIHVPVDGCLTVSDAGKTRLTANVRAPLNAGDDDDEEVLTSNNSSIVLQYQVCCSEDGITDNTFMICGDAALEVWRRLKERHASQLSNLEYELLLAPHHCSWGVFSADKPSSDAKADEDAREALEQTKGKAFIISSSKQIKNNNDNPPAYRSRTEYIDILDDADDRFYCTSEYPDVDEPQLLTFTFTSSGPRPPSKKVPAKVGAAAAASVSKEPRPHG